MKKKWYRSGWVKAAVILLTYAVFVTAVFGCVLISHMGNAGVSLESDKTFEESWKFRSLVFDNAVRITSEMRSEILKDTLEELGETETIDVGVYYGKAWPSIVEAVSAEEKEKSGFEYSVKELRDWAKAGVSTQMDGYQEPIIRGSRADGTYHYFYYQEFLQGLLKGTILCDLEGSGESYFGDSEKNLNNYSKEEIEQFLNYASYSRREIGTVTDRSSSTEQIYVHCIPVGTYNAGLLNRETGIGEKFSPKGYDNVLDFLNSNDGWWNSNLENAYQALGNLLNEINSSLNSTYENLSAYEPGKTNVTYLYADKDSEIVYTNKKEYEDYGKIKESLKKIKKDSYILIDSQEAPVTNIVKGDNSIESLKYHTDNIKSSGEYIFAIEIDTEYPASDKLARANKDFSRYEGKLIPVITMEIVCAVLWLLLIVWLTVTAGRKADDELLHLNGFDRLYTEIGALLTGGVWLVVLYLGFNMYIPLENGKILMIWGETLAMITQTLFLVGWLSLVRRIKGRTIWKNSICRRIFLLIGKVLKKILGFFKGIVNKIIGFIRGKDILLNGLKRISEGELQYKIPVKNLYGKRRTMAEYINNIGAGLDAAVEKNMRGERMKTDLITNVSHDIKTPLTSIINYVDLLKRENFKDPKILGYLQVLDEKSQRLKILAEDVVEASKASSGNINLEMTNLDFVELVHQVLGEFEEKLAEKNLTMMVQFADESSVIRADGQRMWRVLSNIFGNVVKYAMEGTRVYAEVSNQGQKVVFSLKNISAQPLNISADELTERFIRGDLSRNTEGSGLGLSIAKSLTELQGGEFKLIVDGDLFKIMITFTREA